MKAIFSCLLMVFASSLGAEELPDFGLDVAAVEASYTRANDINVAYKVFGEPESPPVVLVMGLGGSHKLWGNNLPGRLVEAGYQVVLFDNRDVGQSQSFEDHGDPTIWWEFVKIQLGFEPNAAYDLSDMAADTIGLMDSLQIQQAHVVGASMGGMIAQVIAAQYPDRVTTLTSIMSTPGMADHLPPLGEVGGFGDDDSDETDAERQARLESFGLHLDAMPRQIMAILKSGDRSDEVKTIAAPTLVLHGNDDTLIPPEHGQYTAELIEGSTYIGYDGMGHNLPAEILPSLVGAMVEHMATGL